MHILDGKKCAKEWREQLKKTVELEHLTPSLAIVTDEHDPASAVYIRQKIKAAEEIGIKVSVHKVNSLEEARAVLNALNTDPGVDGIIIQQPCQYMTIEHATKHINPAKDVDGFIEKGFYSPCTPLGIMTLLKSYNISVKWKHAVVLGRSQIVGKPLARMLVDENATVSLCHSYTPVTLRRQLTQDADIVFSCTGNPGLIKINDVSENAIIIDVGISRLPGGSLSGDVDAREDWSKTNVKLTPVPGGVGPMTVAALMYNTIQAYYINH